MKQPQLSIIPCTIKKANEFIDQHHRHHKSLKVGYFFAIAVTDGDNTRGVAIIGRPVNRTMEDGFTAEVRRVATDGCPNACSILYAAAWRTARGMGYRRLITYTLVEESGASLRGAGWKCIGQAGGGTWNRPNCGRPREDTHPIQPKLRWEKR